MSFTNVFSIILIESLIFTIFTLLITVLGYSILIKIDIKHNSSSSTTIAEKLLISFGLGIALYISYGYLLSLFKLFNFITGYLFIIIYDLIFLSSYLRKGRSQLNIKKLFKRFKKRDVIVLLLILGFVCVNGLLIYFEILTESVGLLRRDPYFWLSKVYDLLDNGNLSTESLGAGYPYGYVITSAGFLLINPNYLTTYYFIKFSPIFYLILIIYTSYIITKKLFNSNFLVLVSLFLILISIYFIRRNILNIPSSLATLLIIISYLLIINKEYPIFIFGFFLSSIFLIHPPSFFFFALPLFPYLFCRLINNFKSKGKAIGLLKSLTKLMIVFIILIIPYIFSFPEIRDTMNFFIKNIIPTANFTNADNFTNGQAEVHYDLINYLSTQFLFDLNDIFDDLSFRTLDIFFMASLFGLLVKPNSRNINQINKTTYLYFKFSLLLVLGFFILQLFFPLWQFSFLYRILESYFLAIIIVATLSVEWLIRRAMLISQKIANKMPFSYMFKKSKFFKIESIIMLLILINIFWIFTIRETPFYYYRYDDDYILMNLYIRNNAKPNSVICRPSFEINDSDYILYDMQYYSYDFSRTPSNSSFFTELIKKDTDYIIYRNYNENFNPTEWFDDSDLHDNVSIEVVENYSLLRNDVIKFTDQHENLNAKFSDQRCGYHQYGTIEWWFLRNESISNDFNFVLKDGYFYSTVVIKFDQNHEIYYFNSGYNLFFSNFSDNIWHHFRIDFECSTSGYMDLSKNKFNFYMDGIVIGENLSMASNFSDSIGWVEFNTLDAKNCTSYIDAVEYSWDSNYEIGDNKFYFIGSYPTSDSFTQIMSSEKYVLYKVN